MQYLLKILNTVKASFSLYEKNIMLWTKNAVNKHDIDFGAKINHGLLGSDPHFTYMDQVGRLINIFTQSCKMIKCLCKTKISNSN